VPAEIGIDCIRESALFLEMTMMTRRIVPVILVCLLAVAFAHGQEKYIELLRSDIKTQKVAMLTEVLELTDEESASFWPVYREYELELDKINDESLAGIKDFVAHYDSMTDDKATELIQQALSLDESRVKLRRRYFKKFQGALHPITVARFYQAERQISMLLRLQLAAELPLIR
jgi:hypothetical protein